MISRDNVVKKYIQAITNDSAINTKVRTDSSFFFLQKDMSTFINQASMRIVSSSEACIVE